MTVIKVADDKQPQLDVLGALLDRPDVDAKMRKRIEEEIWAVRAGIQGEREAAYEINFEYGPRDAFMVIHDLRVEFAGRVAQIDHLIINRALDAWVCETKAFSEGVKIDEYGEWYRYGGGRAHGMASPVEQNRRHVAVLKDIFDKGAVRLPRRFIALKPTLFQVVLISNDARIDRPKTKAARAAVDGLDTVIKIEQLVRTIERTFDGRNPLRILAKVVDKATAEDLARQLVALHRPAPLVGPAKFGLPVETLSPPPQRSSEPAIAPDATDRPQKTTCDSCGKPLSPKVSAYALANNERFRGAALCYDCQRLPANRTGKRPAPGA